jgi:hypothetical protein
VLTEFRISNCCSIAKFRGRGGGIILNTKNISKRKTQIRIESST